MNPDQDHAVWPFRWVALTYVAVSIPDLFMANNGSLSLLEPTPSHAFFLIASAAWGPRILFVAAPIFFIYAHLVTQDERAAGLYSPPYVVAYTCALLALYLTCSTLIRRLWHRLSQAQTATMFTSIVALLAPTGIAFLGTLFQVLQGQAAEQEDIILTWIYTASTLVTITVAMYAPVVQHHLPPESHRRTEVVGHETMWATIRLTSWILVPITLILGRSLPTLQLLTLLLIAAALSVMMWLGQLLKASIGIGGAGILLHWFTKQLWDGATLTATHSMLLIAGIACMAASALAITLAQRQGSHTQNHGDNLDTSAPVAVVHVPSPEVWELVSSSEASNEPFLQALQSNPEVVQALIRRETAAIEWIYSEASGERILTTHMNPSEHGGTFLVTYERSLAKTSRELLQWARNHDGETGLANRQFLLDHLRSSPHSHRPCSIIVLDTGDLIARSRTLGLDLRVLCESLAARTMENDSVRSFTDDHPLLLFRVADDQFVLPLPTSLVHAHEVAAHLVQGNPALLNSGDSPIQVRLIASVVEVPKGSDPSMSLDAALMVARDTRHRSTGDVIVLDSTSLDSTELQAQTSSLLSTADLGNELSVRYQPDVDLMTGRVLGFEALVRWSNPRGRHTPTEDFISMAERCGIINQVDRIVITQALKDFRRWLNQQPELTLGLNLSGRTITADLPRWLQEASKQAQVPISQLRFEVTQTCFVHHEQVLPILRSLQASGARIALDDFGAHYATLDRVRHLPVDILKLDRSFLVGIDEQQAQRAVVSLALGLAHSLDLEFVAEGVESENQRRALVDLGCERGQGFLFSPPLMPGEIDRRISSAAASADRHLRIGPSLRDPDITIDLTQFEESKRHHKD